MFKSSLLAVVAAVAVSSSAARAAVYITEYSYQCAAGEFVELTNTGPAPVDFTGWSYDDDSRTPGSFSLTGLGVVQPGQSVIFTEADAAAFAAAWNLSASVTVLGGNTNNLGRNDEINIYDNSNALVDRLTFGDQNFPGSLRTQNFTANIPLAALGTNNVMLATKSVVGDAYGSYASASADVANPGAYLVPEPGSLAACGLVLLPLVRRSRKGK